MPATGSTTLPLGPRDEAWDAATAQKSLEPADYPKAHFWYTGGPADEIGSYKFPFAHRTDGGLKAVWAGVTHGAQRLSSAKGVDQAAIQKKMAAYYAKAASQYGDEEIEPPWASDDETTEHAAAGGVRFAVAPITHVDVRDVSDSHGFWTMSGYAAVFNQATTLYDGKFLRLTESIDPHAFDTILRDQPLDQPDGVVHFNLGHDMNRSVAATDVPAGQPGSLQLRSDPHGLFFLAKVPMDDPDGVALAAKMRSGVIRQASFAFTIANAETAFEERDNGPDVEHRTILEMKHLYDVCATPQGAYAQTVSGLRSLAAALGQPGEPGDPYVRQPVLGDGHAASHTSGGDVVQSPAASEKARHAFEEFLAQKRSHAASAYQPRKWS